MFAARGLTVQTEEPSDVSDPIKLVAAGRADVGISYEPEMFFAQQKDTPVVAVAALVPRALNSIIANTDDGIHSVADLKGKTIGEDGSKSTAAYLDTVLDHAGIDPDNGVHSCQRRFQPGARAALREGGRGDRRVPEHRGRAAQGGGHAHDHLPGRPLRRAVLRRAGAGRKPRPAGFGRRVPRRRAAIRRRSRSGHGVGAGASGRRGRRDGSARRKRLQGHPRPQRARHAPAARYHQARPMLRGPPSATGCTAAACWSSLRTGRRWSPRPRLRMCIPTH